MQNILEEAAAVGSGMARAICFAARDKRYFFYPNSAWQMGFISGSHEFLRNGALAT
jgi:hypothetical protein